MTSQSPLARSGIPIVAVKSTFSSPFWRPNLGNKKAHSSTNNSHSHFSIAPSSSAPHFTQNMSLSAICKIEAFHKILMWSPSAKIPKKSDFSGLGNLWLRCVRSIVSGAKSLSLKCFIRTFIPSNFQSRHSRRWPAAAFQLLR